MDEKRAKRQPMDELSSLRLRVAELEQRNARLAEKEALYHSFIESSNDCIKILDLEGRLRYLSEAGQRQMHIKDVEPYLNTPYAHFWNGSDRDESLRAIAAARAGGNGRFTGYAATADGEPRWWDVAISPVVGVDGKVRSLLAVSRDITARRRAEAALSRRLEAEKLVASTSARFINVRPGELDDEIRASLRRIGEFTGVDRCYLFQFSADGATMDNTHEWCAPGIEPHIDELQGLSVEHFGYSMAKMRVGEIFHVPRIADLPPEAGPEIEGFEHEGILSLINVPVRIGGVTAGFLGFDRVRRAKSWPEQDRRMIRLVGETFAMALERKRFEEDTQRSLREKDVLLREIHHRVKNNMQIVSSLLVLQSSRTRNREAIGILEDGRQRVQAMALAHEKLHRTADLTHIDLREYLTSLLASIRSTYLAVTPGVGVRAHVENVTSSMDQAIPIGLLVNELVSNALKYAFPGAGSGAVSVGLTLEAGETIELTVADDGVGLPPGLEWRNVPTLGLTLVRELSAQLGGEIERLERPHGTAFRIRFKRVTA